MLIILVYQPRLVITHKERMMSKPIIHTIKKCNKEVKTQSVTMAAIKMVVVLTSKEIIYFVQGFLTGVTSTLWGYKAQKHGVRDEASE